MLYAGKQTLGQEYCDIALATGGGSSSLEGGEYSDVGRPLSSRKLRLYTLIRVGVPYLQVGADFGKGQYTSQCRKL